MHGGPALAIATILTILAWGGLGLQLWLTVNNVMAAGGGALFGIFRNYSYFTVLTNTLAALVLTASVVSAGERSWLSRAGTRAATAAYMTMVGIIYTLLLRQTWDPQGLQKLADVLLHDVMPVAFVLYWVFFWRTRTLRATQAPRWLIYPLMYLGLSLVNGAIASWYPYPFLDAGRNGYAMVMVSAVVIIIAFVVLSLIVVAIDRLRNPGRSDRLRQGYGESGRSF